MRRLFLITLAASLSVLLRPDFSAADPGPALEPAWVSVVRGSVRVTNVDGPAPLAFVLEAGAQLSVGPGARVVVRLRDRTEAIDGPIELELTTLHDRMPPVDSQRARSWVPALLRRWVTASRPAATRGLCPAVIDRPAGEKLLKLEQVTWTCDSCEEAEREQEVVLERLARSDGQWVTTRLWATTAVGVAPYEGPTLEPGNYAIGLCGRWTEFEVPEEAERAAIREALAMADETADALQEGGVSDPATLLAPRVGARLQLGLVDEAVLLIAGARDRVAGQAAALDLLARDVDRTLGRRKAVAEPAGAE